MNNTHSPLSISAASATSSHMITQLRRTRICTNLRWVGRVCRTMCWVCQWL